MMGFLLMLLSLCFSRNIGKNRFILENFFTIRNFDFYTKKSNIGLRLVGHIGLWSKNGKSEVKLFENHGACWDYLDIIALVLWSDVQELWRWHYLLREIYHSRLLTMQGRYHGCHKKIEMGQIKRLITKEEKHVFSPQTVGAEDQQKWSI